VEDRRGRFAIGYWLLDASLLGMGYWLWAIGYRKGNGCTEVQPFFSL